MGSPFWNTVGDIGSGGANYAARSYGSGGGQGGQWSPRAGAEPNEPGYVAGYGGRGIGAGVQQQLGQQQGYNKFSMEAMRNGPSKWAGMAKQNQALQTAQARDQAYQSGANSAATARSQLAMKGGLTGGAAERVAQNAGRNLMDVQADIGRQSRLNNSQIDMNDEQNRIQQLGMLPGMENQRLQMGMQGNMFDASQQNQYNQNWYSGQLDLWKAKSLADSQDRNNPGSANYDDGKRWYNPSSWF